MSTDKRFLEERVYDHFERRDYEAGARPPQYSRYADWIERLGPTLYIRFTRGPDYEDAFLCIDDGEPDMNDVARMSFGQARKLQAAFRFEATQE